MKELVSFYLLVINIISFILMYVDKKKAINHQWRISEHTLMVVSLIGGSIGTILGLKIFRHKTKHVKFYVGVPIIFFIQLILSYYVYFDI